MQPKHAAHPASRRPAASCSGPARCSHGGLPDPQPTPRSTSPTGSEGWGAVGSARLLQGCSRLGQAWCEQPDRPLLVPQCCCPEVGALLPHAATGARSASVLEASGRLHQAPSSAASEQGAEFTGQNNLMQRELMAGRRCQAVPSWAAIAAGSPGTWAQGIHPSPDTIWRRGRSATGSSGCVESQGVNPRAGWGRTHDTGAATACGRVCRRRRPRARW